MTQAINQQPTPEPQRAPHPFACELCLTFGLERSAFVIVGNRMPLCAWHYREWARAVDCTPHGRSRRE